MRHLFVEFDEDDKYWTTKTDWNKFRQEHQPKIQPMKPIEPEDLVYIKLIQYRKEDGVPVNTRYIRRDGNNVNDKNYADLFTLEIAQDYLKRHPETDSQDGQYRFNYEIESVRPY